MSTGAFVVKNSTGQYRKYKYLKPSEVHVHSLLNMFSTPTHGVWQNTDPLMSSSNPAKVISFPVHIKPDETGPLLSSISNNPALYAFALLSLAGVFMALKTGAILPRKHNQIQKHAKTVKKPKRSYFSLSKSDSK